MPTYRLFNATALTLASALAVQTPAQAQDSPIPPEIDGRYQWVEGHYPSVNVRDACIPLQNINDVDNAASEKAMALLDIWSRTDMTMRLLNEAYAGNAVVCFLPLTEESGEKKQQAGYNYYADVIELDENLSEGCQTSMGIQELHHRAQAQRGFEDRPNLTPWDRYKFVRAFEADAHAVQILGSYLLAQPDYSYAPYEGASECISSFNHMAEARDSMMAAIQTDSSAIESGAAALAAYQAIQKTSPFFLNNEAEHLELATCTKDICDDIRAQRREKLPENYDEWVKPMYEIHYPQSYLEPTPKTP